MRLEGRIAGAGFASGDRFVAGIWRVGPLGAMHDVMWATPAGRRILLAGTAEAAAFVGGVYAFDEVRVADFEVPADDVDRLRLLAGPLELELHAGPASKIFALRPRALRRWTPWVAFEDALLRPLVDRVILHGAGRVRLRGTTPSGVREWYCIDEYRPVVWARATLHGVDLGGLGPLEPPAGFGFSEFPRQPALVRCAPVLEGAHRFLPGTLAERSRVARRS